MAKPAPQPELVLELQDLQLGYENRVILRQVSFGVGAGEFWFLLGPNGSGKSTLLKSLLGLLTPQAGQIKRQAALAGVEQVGFVPQRCDLNPTLPTTVKEFVSLGRVAAGRAAHGQADLDWALKKVNLAELAERSYWSLSGGQRQRALLARALVRRPKFLILDEPTNGLDPSSQLLLMDALKALNQDDGLTMLFVTHDLGLAVRYGSHVALFYEGRVEAGACEGVLTPSNLEKVYGVAIELGGHK